ncbi:proteoglycan 4b [Hippocampus comes]|uniref:proteoglycan 4b n=1 Tax=Hippocampus comes TaxID=109280 RepID=UPI00094E648F|nr:PREDICTED: proteoglycan 4-like [Hippocampus comes]
MSWTPLRSLILLACSLTPVLSQNSCKERCGNEYYRGYLCQCDYNCMAYGECCLDFESQCTTKNSCKGRCGETFKRGQLCSCDSDCVKFKQCCPDYKIHCDAKEETANEAEDPFLPLSGGNTEGTDTETIPSDYQSNTPDRMESDMPDSTGSYASSPFEPLEAIPTQDTLIRDTLKARAEAVPSVTSPSRDVVKSTTVDRADGVTYTESEDSRRNPTTVSDSRTTFPQATMGAKRVSNQPSWTSASQAEPSPTGDNRPSQPEYPFQEMSTPRLPSEHTQGSSRYSDSPDPSRGSSTSSAQPKASQESSTPSHPQKNSQESSTSSGPPPETSHRSSRPSQPEYPFQEMSTPRLPSEHIQGSSRSSDSPDPSRGSSTSSAQPKASQESSTPSRPQKTSKESSTSSGQPPETSHGSFRPSQPEYPFQEMSTPRLPSEHTQGSSRSSDSPDPSQWSSTSSAQPKASQELFTPSRPQKTSQESSTSSGPTPETSHGSSKPSQPEYPFQEMSTPRLPSEHTQGSSRSSDSPDPSQGSCTSSAQPKASQESCTPSRPQKTSQESSTSSGPTPETSHGSSKPSQPEYPFQEMSTPRLPSEHTQGSSRSSDSPDPSRGSSTSSEDSRRNPTTVSDSRTTFPQATMGAKRVSNQPSWTSASQAEPSPTGDNRPSQPEYPFQELSTPLLPSEHTQGSSRSSDSPDPSRRSSTSSEEPKASQESSTPSRPHKTSQESSPSSEPPPKTSHGSSRPSQPEYPFLDLSTPRLPSDHTQGSSRSSDSPDASQGSCTSSVQSKASQESCTPSRPQKNSQESSTSSGPPPETSHGSSRPSQPEYPFLDLSTPRLPSEHTQGSSRSSDSPDPSQRPSTFSAPPNASQESSTNSAPQKPTQDSATNTESSEAPHTPDSTWSFPPSVPTTSVVTTAQPFSLPDRQNYSTGVSPVGSDLDVTMTVNPSPTDALQGDFKDKVTPTESSIAPVTETPKSPSAKAPESTLKPKPNTSGPPMTAAPEDKPALKPAIKPVDAVLTVDSSRHYQPDDNDTNLCSGRPPSAFTTLRNGTIAVFRGHLFWFLDRNRVPGPAHDITQMWGVPSPIDTVFTRCNCQGKTYIFKGNQYWRFDNNHLDPGYPKVVESGFDGLQGHITAALSVPQYRRRRESVYFFKRGGLVQKYSYQFGTSPSCSKKAHFAIYTVRNRVARQAVSLLGPTINIRRSWRGFPTIITSAVSVPSYREPEGYRYYVFSRSKSYNIRLDGERPVVTSPIENPSAQNNNFINCPKTL